jgi:hypothetical protein
MTFVMVTDKRLGLKMPPTTYNMEVDGTLSLQSLVDIVLTQLKALTLVFSSHGLPGYVQCLAGVTPHPTAGPGITINDLPAFRKMRPKLNASFRPRRR